MAPRLSISSRPVHRTRASPPRTCSCASSWRSMSSGRVKPRRLNDAARITPAVLARSLDWRRLLVVVRPETLVRWHGQGFRFFWRRKSRRPGRPADSEGGRICCRHVRANRTWGEERIAAQLRLKWDVAVSPRTVRRYMRRPVPSRPVSSSPTWSTCVRNHARETLACDFFVAVTAAFRLLYHRKLLQHGDRRASEGWGV
jgi:hypothetical protein